jgi:predicted nucleic acid-binding protein
MQPVLFDSSIYITALRTGDEAALSLRRFAVDSPIWLSAVVLEELYAGIAPRGWHVLARLERAFEKARRILERTSTTGQRPAKYWPVWPPSMIPRKLDRAD